MPLSRSPTSAAGALGLWVLMGASAPAQAQQEQRDSAAQTVVVTGSTQQRRIDEAPFAISAIGAAALGAAGPMVNLSEALVQVPGLVVNNRANYAQDLQISSRGFGARAGFGVRGMRLVADGIPASGPDGQGQVSHFDIAGAQRIEVLRGPYSVLYGNSSGGVIATFSAPVTQREVQFGLDAGSFGLQQARASLALPLTAGIDVKASVSHLKTDGFRPQSAARKTQAQARLAWRGSHDTVTALLNHLDQPADDPLGLTRAQFNLGPEQTAPEAISFNTRKTTEQTQGGLSWRHRFADEGALRDSLLTLYSGQRSVAQWLAIPAATQGNVRHGGGVIAFDRDYQGLDGRLRWHWPASGVELVVGVAADGQRDARQGFENFTGTAPNQVLGVTGRLRRDEGNKAQTRDAYVQGEFSLGQGLHLNTGLRSGRVRLSSSDTYLVNGDDSGQLNYSYTNPVLGLRWQVAPGLNLHASAARGFESPTLGELAYRIDGSGGFNTALLPQTSKQLELGTKWRAGGVSIDATFFEVHTANEIGVATNSGGRSAFQNVGRTLRRGVELGLGWRPNGPLSAQLALSSLQSRYLDAFFTCAAVPCNAPNVLVSAGGRIAGAPQGSAWGELAWAGGAWGQWALEWRYMGKVAVNDRNTDFAFDYHLAAMRWNKTTVLGGGLRAEWLVRVDNLADRAHAGSVIVNDANGRFFEPGTPRHVLLALRLPLSF